MTNKRRFMKKISTSKKLSNDDKLCGLMILYTSLNFNIKDLEERLYFETNKSQLNSTIATNYAYDKILSGEVSDDNYIDFRNYLENKFNFLRNQDFKQTFQALISKVSTQLIGLIGVIEIFERTNVGKLNDIKQIIIGICAVIGIQFIANKVEKVYKPKTAEQYKIELNKIGKLRKELEIEMMKLTDEIAEQLRLETQSEPETDTQMGDN